MGPNRPTPEHRGSLKRECSDSFELTVGGVREVWRRTLLPGSGRPQCLKRGTFSSVKELEESMKCCTENYNRDAKPFIWTKSAEYLLGKMKRKQIVNTEN